MEPEEGAMTSFVKVTDTSNTPYSVNIDAIAYFCPHGPDKTNLHFRSLATERMTMTVLGTPDDLKRAILERTWGTEAQFEPQIAGNQRPAISPS
jgi:hypothetical protein